MDHTHVGAAEVISFEEEWCVKGLGKSVGIAATQVQACRMASFAEALEGCSGQFGLLAVKGDDVDRCSGQEQIKMAISTSDAAERCRSLAAAMVWLNLWRSGSS